MHDAPPPPQEYFSDGSQDRPHQKNDLRGRGSALRDQTERSESPRGQGKGAKGGGWGINDVEAGAKPRPHTYHPEERGQRGEDQGASVASDPGEPKPRPRGVSTALMVT